MTKKHVWTCAPDTSVDDGNQKHADSDRPSIKLTTSTVLFALLSAHHNCVCHQSASGLFFDQSIDTRSLAFAALESLVEHRITGLPVVDEEGKVVGVVSDYDMLTLDNVSGPMEKAGIFPTASMDWEAFHEVQKLILKNTGKLYVPSLVPDDVSCMCLDFLGYPIRINPASNAARNYAHVLQPSLCLCEPDMVHALHLLLTRRTCVSGAW